MSDIKQQKKDLREHARRARSLMMLDLQGQEAFSTAFFKNLNIGEGTVVASYWPIGREFDTHILMDECLERGADIALPVIEEGSRILKFARWRPDMEMDVGAYGIAQPVINEQTALVEPDIVIVPLLAYDRRGYRLGYGGGYYDSTIADLKSRKDVITVGIGFSKQACLFNLPVEEHDIKMDWIITEQSAQKFT